MIALGRFHRMQPRDGVLRPLVTHLVAPSPQNPLRLRNRRNVPANSAVFFNPQRLEVVQRADQSRQCRTLGVPSVVFHTDERGQRKSRPSRKFGFGHR